MPYKVLITSLCLTVLVGCTNEEEESRASSDYTSAEIEAHYAIEVMDDNKVHFYGNFYAANQSLELTGGDEAYVEINSTSEALVGQEVSGLMNYSLVETLDPIAASYVFDLSRTSHESAALSVVKIPQGFTPTQPLADSPVYAVNNAFLLLWQDIASAEPENVADPEVVADGKAFTLRYDFDCRNGNANSNAIGSYVEKVKDDGIHEVDLNKVFDIPAGGGSFNRCDKFDITLIRSDANGHLDSGLKGGSATGAQVRFVRNLSIEDLL